MLVLQNRKVLYAKPIVAAVLERTFLSPPIRGKSERQRGISW